MRFAIGEAVVDVVVDDDDFEVPLSDFLPGLDPGRLAKHLAALEPDFLGLARDRLKLAVQSFVIRTGGRTILIDSCIGDDRDRPDLPVWNQRHATGFLDRLKQAGTEPAAVRRGLLHPSPRRPRRLEHPPGRRPLRSDLPQRPLSVRPQRARLVAGAA
jgi:hypothetical protein